MNIIAKAFAVLLSFSPNVNAKVGADEYRFEKKEYEHTELTVKIVVARSREEFAKLQAAHGLRQETVTATGNKYQTEAFSVLHPRDRECIIFIKDPEWNYQPEYIGHELAHCVWGRWHGDVQ